MLGMERPAPSDALNDALALVQGALGQLESTLMAADVDEVTALVTVFDQIGRAASAGWAKAGQRAEALQVHNATGHRNAADWLSQSSGVSFARAKEALGLAKRLEKSAPVRDAFDRGELSPAQAGIIADVVDEAPEAGAEMLRVARVGSHQELNQQALLAKQAARSREDERRRSSRSFHRRSLRFTQLPDGGVRVQAYLTDQAWARCLSRIDARANVLFRRGRKAKVHATRDQYRVDALVDLVTGQADAQPDVQVEPLDAAAPAHGASTGTPKPQPVAPSGRPISPTSVTTIVRIDASALRRGWVVPGEMCEIAGVGPVSVDTARELLGEWYFRLLVTDGTDVTTITGRHRHVPARVEAALFERDRTCVVPQCNMTFGLETHHWQIEVRANGPTNLENLCRLCSVHHDMASTSGWVIRGGPGQWEWVGPSWRVSDELRHTRRQVAAARGRSPSD